MAFEANVSSNKISLGSSTQLTLVITGPSNVQPIPLPAIDGFDSKYVGLSIKMVNVNGQRSNSTNFLYSLFPTKTGRFTIPALTVAIDGKTYTSQPIDMEVTDQPAADSTNAPGTNTQSIGERLFLVLESPKTESYVGERIPLKIKLYVNGLNVRDIELTNLDHEGFILPDTFSVRQEQELVKGVRHDVVVYNTFIYPNKDGDLIVGPAHLNCSLLYRSSRGEADSMFDDFFATFEKRPTSVVSQPLAIKVLPLPEAGKPADFSGAVGQFDFEVTATPSEVKVGDPVTLRMKVIGGGNLKAIQMPLFKNEQFKIYDPQIKEEANAKILEQVIIPTSEKITEIPAVNFSFFDSAANEYRTLARGPFPIKVTTPAPGQEFKAVGFTQNIHPLTEEQLGRDIIFIKENAGRLRLAGSTLLTAIGYWLVMMMVVIIWIVLTILFYIFERMRKDVGFARRLKAPRQAKKGLVQARQLLAKGETKKFYSVLSKTLCSYLGNKFHVPSVEMTFAAVAILLESKKIKDETVSHVRNLFETCDMARFASMTLEEEKMRKDLTLLEAIIEELEDEL